MKPKRFCLLFYAGLLMGVPLLAQQTQPYSTTAPAATQGSQTSAVEQAKPLETESFTLAPPGDGFVWQPQGQQRDPHSGQAVDPAAIKNITAYVATKPGVELGVQLLVLSPTNNRDASRRTAITLQYSSLMINLLTGGAKNINATPPDMTSPIPATVVFAYSVIVPGSDRRLYTHVMFHFGQRHSYLLQTSGRDEKFVQEMVKTLQMPQEKPVR